jgi:transposase
VNIIEAGGLSGAGVCLTRCEAAAQAAMEYTWSNGQMEGQINRLKMVKRQMFGRANLDLLKARVLNAA